MACVQHLRRPGARGHRRAMDAAQPPRGLIALHPHSAIIRLASPRQPLLDTSARRRLATLPSWASWAPGHLGTISILISQDGMPATARSLQAAVLLCLVAVAVAATRRPVRGTGSCEVCTAPHGTRRGTERLSSIQIPHSSTLGPCMLRTAPPDLLHMVHPPPQASFVCDSLKLSPPDVPGSSTSSGAGKIIGDSLQKLGKMTGSNVLKVVGVGVNGEPLAGLRWAHRPACRPPWTAPQAARSEDDTNGSGSGSTTGCGSSSDDSGSGTKAAAGQEMKRSAAAAAGVTAAAAAMGRSSASWALGPVALLLALTSPPARLRRRPAIPFPGGCPPPTTLGARSVHDAVQGAEAAGQDSVGVLQAQSGAGPRRGLSGERTTALLVASAFTSAHPMGSGLPASLPARLPACLACPRLVPLNRLPMECVCSPA